MLINALKGFYSLFVPAKKEITASENKVQNDILLFPSEKTHGQSRVISSSKQTVAECANAAENEWWIN